MSTIVDITNDYLASNAAFSAEKARALFIENPEAIKDLTYGNSRKITNALPAHDHSENGGESLYDPIISYSFGSYLKTGSAEPKYTGIPLGPYNDSSADYSSDDPSTAKRLLSMGCVIPGGVLGVRITLLEFHNSSGETWEITACFRNYSDVNKKLTSDEVSVAIGGTTSGSATYASFIDEITDLSLLGDPTKDREVEFSLWMTNNFTVDSFHRLCSVEVLPLYFTATARSSDNTDSIVPSISYREIQAGVGTITPNLVGKVKELYNNLNRGIWGTTPGLLNNNLPDTRINYQSTIERSHTHQGIYCTDTDGNIYSDGACLINNYSTAYYLDLGDSMDEYPVFDAYPTLGIYLHTVADLSSGWVTLKFRHSIPNGLGALKFRFGIYTENTDPLASLYANVAINPIIDPATNIVTTQSCSGSSVRSNSMFCELTPVDDDFFQSVSSRKQLYKKHYTMDAALAEDEISNTEGNYYLYRINEPLVVGLTHPPSNALQAVHLTGDYMISIRLKLLESTGDADTTARIQWLNCYSAEGY